MICIAVREAGERNSWKARRSGETIGFHRQEKETRILATVYLENTLKDGVANYIELLHPGNVEGRLVTDTPLADHPDEREKQVKNNILYELYGEAFEIEKKGEMVEGISQVKALSAWDIWYETKERQPVNWAGDKRTIANPPQLKLAFPPESKNGFAPFTVWKIGPFTQQGPVLVSLEIYLRSESYQEFVECEQTFAVDGPEHLLARLEYTYIPRMDKEDRCLWKKELCKFKNHLSAGQSYDIVLLGDQFADEVEVLEKSGVTKANLQPQSEHIGVRYITDDPNFTMSLRYAKSTRNESKEAAKNTLSQMNYVSREI
jgi:hypothetical protein